MNLQMFVLGGIILIVSGIAQAFVRPRRAGETTAQKIVNAATVRATVFVVVGTLAILVGAGVLPLLPMRR